MDKLESKYSYILENIRFSYSAVSTFETCPYAYKLTYIDAKNRTTNYFGEYGLLTHEIFEKYWKDELEIWDLEKYYRDNYYSKVISPIPLRINDDKYYTEGLKFFSEFNIEKNKEMIIIEDGINSEHKGIKVIIKPDLVYKENGEVVLMDYKTSLPRDKKGNLDKKKLSSYKKQLLLYLYFIEKEKNIKINKIQILFTRVNEIIEVEFNNIEVLENLNQFIQTIYKIFEEEKFEAKPNAYFCTYLCGVAEHCPFKKSI